MSSDSPSSSDGGDAVGRLMSTAKWAVENDVFLDVFVEKQNLPCLALITRGQHMSVGAPTVASPHLRPYVLVHSSRLLKKAVGTLVRIKDGKRKPVVGQQKVVVPESYRGYFEVLSEEGKPVKCLETVMELTHKFPECCLLRQACKAYLPDNDGELRNLSRSRTLHEGEELTLVGQFNLRRSAFLRCFDEFGASVYLKMSQKGRFSPICPPPAPGSSQAPLEGVLPSEALMSLRLPVTVRLVLGFCPPQLGGKQHLPGGLILQLDSIITDQLVFLYALKRGTPVDNLITVKGNAHLKLAPALNQEQMKKRKQFLDVCFQCERALTRSLDEMTVVTDSSSLGRDIYQEPMAKATTSPSTKDQLDDEEIDQLYDYVRGLGPLPKTCQQEREKPTPPPIDTIPVNQKAKDNGKQAEAANRLARLQSGRRRSRSKPTRSKEKSGTRNGPDEGKKTPSPTISAGPPLAKHGGSLASLVKAKFDVYPPESHLSPTRNSVASGGRLNKGNSSRVRPTSMVFVERRDMASPPVEHIGSPPHTPYQLAFYPPLPDMRQFKSVTNLVVLPEDGDVAFVDRIGITKVPVSRAAVRGVQSSARITVAPPASNQHQRHYQRYHPSANLVPRYIPADQLRSSAYRLHAHPF